MSKRVFVLNSEYYDGDFHEGSIQNKKGMRFICNDWWDWMGFPTPKKNKRYKMTIIIEERGK